jgi:hypothetical protein
MSNLRAVGGRFEGCVGNHIWVGLSGSDGEIIRIHGPARTEGDRFVVDSSGLGSSDSLTGGVMAVEAFSTKSLTSEGLELRRPVVGDASSSARAVFELETPLAKPDAPALAIDRADTSVRDDKASGATYLALSGNTNPATDGPLHYYLAVLGCGGSCWDLSPEALEGGGVVRVAEFRLAPDQTPLTAREIRLVASPTRLLPSRIPVAALGRMTVGTSSPVWMGKGGVDDTSSYRLAEPAPARGSNVLKTIVALLAWLLGIVFLLFLVLVLFQRRLAMLSKVFSHIARAATRMEAAVRPTLVGFLAPGDGSSPESPRVTKQQIGGILTLAVVVYVVFGHFLPLHQKVILSLLKLPKENAYNLSVGLITFSALSGLLLEQALGVLWPPSHIRGLERFLKATRASIVALLLFAIVLALPMIQTLMYAKFYENQAPAISISFGLMALLMCVIEAVGFAIGIHVGLPLIAWLAIGSLVWLPIAATASVARLLEEFLKKPPDDKVQGGGSRPTASSKAPVRRDARAGDLSEDSGLNRKPTAAE